jgi:hypothetical protein
MDYLVHWYSGWDDYTVEAEQFIDAGEYVIVDVRESASLSRAACEWRRTSLTSSSSATERSWSGGSSDR